MDNRFGSDKERQVEKGVAWTKFKDYLSSSNPNLDIEAILKKTDVRKEPVISYGILEFVIAKSSNPESETPESAYFHVFRRRHTIEYGILLQGYAQRNQLFHLICLLSRDERQRILTNEWQDLWDDYWIDHNSTGYTNLQAQSKRRFTEIREILTIINNDVTSRIEQRPYIFPKGKPEKNESALQAALREAREESKVNFSTEDPTTGELHFAQPIIQQYSGSDDRPYKDYYYVWKRDAVYACPTQILTTRKGSWNSDPVETPRLRNTTISHELEADTWIEIPLFKSNKARLEWIASTDPFTKYHMFKRHFDVILEVHAHLCQ